VTRQIFLSLIILATLISTGVEARTKKSPQITRLSGVIEKCHDGDTCRVAVNEKVLKVRFAGIDCPELSQPNGKQARDFTQSLIKGKKVDLECEGKSFDRLTCTVYLSGKNINQQIVESGWAYDSTKYSKGRYLASANEAREKKMGMWKTKNNSDLSPYCYRHKSNKKCKSNPQYMP